MARFTLIYECRKYKKTIEHSYEVDEDATLDEFESLESLRTFLLAVGYSSKAVDNLLGL